MKVLVQCCGLVLCVIFLIGNSLWGDAPKLIEFLAKNQGEHRRDHSHLHDDNSGSTQGDHHGYSHQGKHVHGDHSHGHDDHHQHGTHDHGGHGDGSHHGHGLHEHQGHDVSVPISLSELTRRNLGVTFYKVEKRPIAKILKVPGYFELEPKSKQRYILPISGRIDLKVKALAKVKRGDVLMSLDSPQWRDLQMKLLGAKESIRDAELEYIEASSANLALGAFGADADGHSLSAAKLKLAQAAVQNQKSKFQQWLIQASLLSSYSVEELLEDKGRRPLWHRLQRITFRAVQDGVVDRLHFSSGSWGEAGQMVLSTVAPSKLRFKAKVLQADALDQSLEGLSVRIMPPKGRGRDESHEPIMGKVKLGVTGDSVTRTTDIFIDLQNQKVAKWMRPQLSALAEIVLEGGLEKSVLSIPKRALIQDGLDTVFFRRRKGRPDEVYRTIADLGVRGLAEVEVKQGLELGDEVVMDGLYQLKLSTTGQKVEAGHFHADGTWHDGDH